VNQRRSVVCVVAACVVATLTVSSAARQAQSPWKCDPCQLEEIKNLTKQEGEPDCRPIVGDTGLVRGYLRDGLVHFRVEYIDPIGELHQTAFQTAMDMWNAQSHVTGFVFEKAQPKGIVDFHLKAGPPKIPPTTKAGKPNEKTSCSGYMASYIWYSRKNKYWLQKEADVANGARAYAHELGHALGLGDYTGAEPSVMRAGDKSKPCHEVVAGLPTKVQDSDAKAARRCGCKARLDSQGPSVTQ
jgi:hypothetical protein